MFRVTLTQAIMIMILDLALLYISWTVWQRLSCDWAMAIRGVTVLATVTEVVPVLAGDHSAHRALLFVPRIDGTSFQCRVRGWPGHSFVEGGQVGVRYDPNGRIEARLVDRWLWKAGAASLTAH